MMYDMLSPIKAPAAATSITSAIDKCPEPALTPPMMTSVSLGTIGITESAIAIVKIIK